MKYLYTGPILPKGFEFPSTFLDVVNRPTLPDLAPWEFLCGDLGRTLSGYALFLAKYPDRPLVPFAMCQDGSGLFNDGWAFYALFDGSNTSATPSVMLYNGMTPLKSPWDLPTFASFPEWVEWAKKQSEEYKIERAEIDSFD